MTAPTDERLAFLDRPTVAWGLLTFRVILVVMLLAGTVSRWPRPSGELAIVAGVLLVALVATILARSAVPGSIRFPVLGLAGQGIVDLLIVTALVRLGGENADLLAALYVVVIAAYTLLLPVLVAAGLLLVGSGLYLTSQYLAARGALPEGIWGQLAVFGFVFALVALLVTRMQRQAFAQRRIASELSRARSEAGQILETIKTGIISIAGNGTLVYANPAAERLLGPAFTGARGAPALDRLRALSPALHDAVAQGLRHGERVGRGEGEVSHPEGRTFPIGLSTTIVPADDGRPAAVTALFTDLSEQKRLQELHLRAERFEAVAALSASLAHEIRNPLASIRSAVEQLVKAVPDDEDNQVLGRLIVRESERLSRLLGEFLDFSRVRAAEFSPLDLRALVDETIGLLQSHPALGQANLTVTGSSTPIAADSDLLHRLVSNLVLNAVQAVGGRGDVRVRVGLVTAEIRLPNGEPIEEPVELVVEDTGPGIDPEVRDRLFQPFVSRREGGSGLGLAIVQRAVEAHRGVVMVESRPGEGARFTVYLPSRPFREEFA